MMGAATGFWIVPAAAPTHQAAAVTFNAAASTDFSEGIVAQPDLDIVVPGAAIAAGGGGG
jgi:hypothetical protein